MMSNCALTTRSAKLRPRLRALRGVNSTLPSHHGREASRVLGPSRVRTAPTYLQNSASWKMCATSGARRECLNSTDRTNAHASLPVRRSATGSTRYRTGPPCISSTTSRTGASFVVTGSQHGQPGPSGDRASAPPTNDWLRVCPRQPACPYWERGSGSHRPRRMEGTPFR